MKKRRNENRVQYMLPGELHSAKEKLSLIFLPVSPIEWHGPHLAMGMDAINAENMALSLADSIGGVVYPTLYMGTERERPGESLKSLGFEKGDYIVGMDFPTVKNLFGSFLAPEEIFALIVRCHIELFIKAEYEYVFIVNGHGALNHNQVLDRLCIEFSNTLKNVKVSYALAFPRKMIDANAVPHASKEETSLLMYLAPECVDVNKLPDIDKPLYYADYAVVDGGGFIGNPGKDFSVPSDFDPRNGSNANFGKKLFKKTFDEIAAKIRKDFKFDMKKAQRAEK